MHYTFAREATGIACPSDAEGNACFGLGILAVSSVATVTLPRVKPRRS
jgi:hypothetical protein